MKEKLLIPVVNKSDNNLPDYSTDGAFAMDIRSNESLVIPYLSTKIVKTGLFVEVPEEYALRIVPRSGLSSKGVLISNSPGTIDEDYRGEVGIIITNVQTNEGDFEIRRGDRIAQCYLEKKIAFAFVKVDSLSETKRGEGGFGSTGVK